MKNPLSEREIDMILDGDGADECLDCGEGRDDAAVLQHNQAECFIVRMATEIREHRGKR